MKKPILLWTVLCLLVVGLESTAWGQPLPVPPGLLFGTKWGSSRLGTPATVTWSMQASGPSQTPLSSFLPEGYDTQIRSAFQTWSQVANITFVEVPSGGQIRLYGRAIDGPGGTAGLGQYPGTGSSFVQFDTGNTWTTDPTQPGSYVYQLALHEIGHTIGLAHPPGIVAAMNHVVSRAYEGLLPADIAGAQALYGPSATINNALYIPTHIRNLEILPTSQITATVSLSTLFSATDTSYLSGTIQSRVDLGPTGDPVGLTFYGSDISLSNVNVHVVTPLIDGQASFTGLQGDLFSKNWFGPTGGLTPIVGGSFDVSQLVLGLVDGMVNYNIQVPIAGISLRDRLELYFDNVGPTSFGATDVGQRGTIERIGSDLFLDIPLNVISTISVPANGVELPVEVRVAGLIHARTSIPEASSLVLVFVALAGWGVMARQRHT